MAYFHFRCGNRVTLQNDNCTAVRNHFETIFDHGVVITAEPLTDDVLFEVKIDKKTNNWSGGVVIGVTEVPPAHLDFPHCAIRLSSSWLMSGFSLVRNGIIVGGNYGTNLDSLNQEDRVGLIKTSDGDLLFLINGESQGVAFEGLPSLVYGVVDLYGKCVQVTITHPVHREHNNDDCMSGSSVLAIENDTLNVTLGADISELSLSSSNSLDIRMDMNVSLSLPEEMPATRARKLCFHERCGSLIKLSNEQRSAERRRPLDEFNNGVVMTHRPLKDGELFEIRIDRLVDKWSGSIEMGITTHNPSTLVFPATMTNMRTGTIMMSGCGILTNGKGTRREYGDFNLDELSEGDRVGMMRKSDGNLHYFINGLDQGVAAQRVPQTVWAVIDLYGMTIKVSIVERDEREEQNLMTRRNTRDQQPQLPESKAATDFYDRLTFHPNCGSHAQVINNGRTAHRPNAADDFNNGVVLTTRPLKSAEMFEVRLDRVVTKWAGSIEIGVTTHSPTDLEFPFTMTNVRSGTWMMTGSGIMHNGITVLEQYGVNLDRLQVSDRVGVVRKCTGYLHFFVNGVDQGVAASNVPERVFGVIDLYGQAVEATIVDVFDYGSPDTLNSSVSNTTLYSDLRFHHVHGRNAMIINNGLTAWRPQPLAEFNGGIVFSNRPLRDGELFEITIDSMVDRWSGSIELGVTAVRPDDIDLPSTATDLGRDTWMLSGSSVMENGVTIKSNYACDLDLLVANTRIGVLQTADHKVEFFRDGVSQGVACVVPHANLYAVVDLYGQCAQVSIPCASPVIPLPAESCPRSETSASLRASPPQPNAELDTHQFYDFHSKAVALSGERRIASRSKEYLQAIVYSATPLTPDEIFEVCIEEVLLHLAGTICIGVTMTPPTNYTASMPLDTCYLTGNEMHYKNKLQQLFAPSLQWLRIGDRIGILKMQDGGLKVFVNGEELPVSFPALGDVLYAVVDLKGTCSRIQVLSRRISIVSPGTSVRLQDSLEFATDQECGSVPIATIGEEVEEGEIIASLEREVPEATANLTKFEFHENHGRNIEVISKVVARRVASYNQGIVLVQPALKAGNIARVVVEQVDRNWASSVMVGLVCGAPERLLLPGTLLSFKGSCCVLANDWISINGSKNRSNYGQRLQTLGVGDVVGVCLTDSGLQLVVNNVAEDILPWQPATTSCYAVFDLYGQCTQVKLLNSNDNDEHGDVEENAGEGRTRIGAECEKADLEACEKERLSLPLVETTATVTGANNANISNNHSTTPVNIPVSHLKLTPLTPTQPCSYLTECCKFKASLLLPDDYFTDDDPSCYCTKCFKTNSVDAEALRDETLIGWVKFPLKNLWNTQTDKWHSAYYPSKLGTIRCILDKGQLLTKEQMQYHNMTGQRHDDLQVVFSPSIDQCQQEPFALDQEREAMATFQLLVKPGAYSVARDSSEWSTKETGAISLQALLLHLSPM